MPYDFQAIENFCRREGFGFERVSSAEMVVRIDWEVGLRIANAKSEDDLYIGLSDGTWHAHGDAMFMDSPTTSLQFDPLDVLSGLKSGLLLMGCRYLRGELKDRWLFHREEKQDFRYIEAGEWIVVRRE